MSKAMETELQKLIGNNKRRDKRLFDVKKRIKMKGGRVSLSVRSKDSLPVKK